MAVMFLLPIYTKYSTDIKDVTTAKHEVKVKPNKPNPLQ